MLARVFGVVAAAACSARAAAGGDVSLSLRGEASHTFRADLDDDGGGADVAVSRVGGGIDVNWAAASKLRLIFGFDTEVSRYDFGGGGLDDLLETALSHELSVTAIWSHNEALSFIAFGSVMAGYEPGADFGDGLTYRAGAAVGLKINESLSLRLGGGAQTRLEDNAVFVPFVGVDWRINEKTRLSTEGLGVRITTSVRDDLDVYLRAGAEWREFRLDDGNDVLPSGVVTDLRVPVGLGLTWKPADGLALTVEGGAIVWQEYERRDDDNKVSDTNTDPAGYIGFRLSWMF